MNAVVAARFAPASGLAEGRLKNNFPICKPAALGAKLLLSHAVLVGLWLSKSFAPSANGDLV